MEENLGQSEWIEGVRETGFTTPSNYFEDLTLRIQTEVMADRLRSVVAEDGFSVPEGYFENLKSNILAQTTQQQHSHEKFIPGKIQQLWRSGWLKYACAACILIISGLGIYYNAGNTSVGREIQGNYSDIPSEQLLFDIDEDLIIEHIESHYESKGKMNASDAAMENYILSNYSQNDLAGIL